MDDAEIASLVHHLRAAADAPEDGGIRGLAASIAGGAKLEGAACVGRAPLFDADVHGESPAARAALHGRARRVCRRCPVQNGCRDAADAMPYELLAGMWAGTVWGVPVEHRWRIWRKWMGAVAPA